MRYDATPRPEVEHHHHIRELIERQEVRAADRTDWKNRVAERGELDKLIRETPQVTQLEFWCDHCKKDFIAVAQLQVEDDWTSVGRIASYRTKCFKGHWCARLVTDKQRDPYWWKSKKVRTDRARHATDMTQPFEDGFNMLYGKPIHI